MKPKRKVNWVELMTLGFFSIVQVGSCPHRLVGAECHPYDQEQLQMGYGEVPLNPAS